MLTVERLNELLRYDPETGELRWRRRHNNSIRADLSCGYLSQAGYIEFMVDRSMQKAHRVGWALHYGKWPEGQIDHINGSRSDNRIANLRDVTPEQNQKNCKLDKRNTSGVSGVRFNPSRKAWEASIRTAGKCLFLGRYKHFDAAVSARRTAEREYGFHPNHGRTLAGPETERAVK